MIKDMVAGLFAVVWLGVVSFAQKQHIFYRRTDGHLNHIWTSSDINHDQWTVAANAPLATGDPTPMLTGN